jgi:stage II sporulation protein D
MVDLLSGSSDDWILTCKAGGVQWIDVNPKNGTRKGVLPSPVFFRSSSEIVLVNQHEYRGQIEVRSRHGACEVIDHLSVENYLRGVVNSEVSAGWSEEALAAQVVAARTYAYYQISAGALKKFGFDVDSSVKDQMYEGMLKENIRSSRIVEQTQGEVLTASQGSRLYPIKAFYHSTCGGETELPERVWDKKYTGFKRRVACPFCRTSPTYFWSLELSPSEIASAVLRGVDQSLRPVSWSRVPRQLFKAQNLLAIQSWSGSDHQRTSDVLTVWQGRGSRVALKVSAAQLREWIGFSRMRSAWFQIRPRILGSGLKAWVFQGRGNGHGVGMCQWGVKEMGAKGYRYASILRHYYPDAILRKLW